MDNELVNDNIFRIKYNDKKITIVGTAHVSKESVNLVKSVIEEEQPDTVCVELCDSRYQAIINKDKWQEMDIIKVIKEKKVFLLLSNLLLSSFQRRIAKKLDIKPGQEMIQAIESGKKIGSDICLADRDIRITLYRTWNAMNFFKKIKLLFQFVLSIGNEPDIKEEDIEKMKNQDAIESILEEVGQSLPELRKTLIHERDLYLISKIRSAQGRKIVGVVGAGHLNGVKEHFNMDIDIKPLEEIQKKKSFVSLIKWLIPLGIFVLLICGFFYRGTEAATNMVVWWIIANGVLAGIGALIAFAHPFTIISSVLAAPLTSLNPMIAAGWVSGLVEAFLRKPKVIDFENLHNDILSVRGFWKNRVTKILLVVVFTNIGSAIGTFVAIPIMLRIL